MVVELGPENAAFHPWDSPFWNLPLCAGWMVEPAVLPSSNCHIVNDLGSNLGQVNYFEALWGRASGFLGGLGVPKMGRFDPPKLPSPKMHPFLTKSACSKKKPKTPKSASFPILIAYGGQDANFHGI